MQNSVPTRQKPQYFIKSVDRALHLVLMFEDGRQLRLSDVRDELGVGMSTAHRIMAMLVYHGFAEQADQTRLYRPGPTLFRVGLSVIHAFDLRQVARPWLEALGSATKETIHLGIPDGADVLYIDMVESELALRISGRVGQRLPAHATSMGKAMLAALADEQIAALYPKEALDQVTPQTVTRRSALLEEIKHVRAAGYATNSEESEIGVASTGVAIVHKTRGLVGGLTVAAPLSRMTKNSRQEHVEALTEAARELGEALT